MREMTYRVGDLRKLVSESSNEFKAVLGKGVESENKTNSDKTYSDSKKRAKDYDGGLNDEKDWARGKAKYEKTDANGTMLDYNPENASEDYKKRVHAQVKGYSSEQEEKNGIEKANDYSDNENIYQGFKKVGKEMHKNQKDFKKSGLQAREMPDSTFDKDEMYESKDGADMRNLINMFRNSSVAPKSVIKEERKLKTVYFKKTTFLNEEHMISRIPDEFKNEGSQFKMKDKTGKEYIVEWKNNNGNVLSYTNDNGVNESLDRMKSLFNYSSKDTETTNSYRLHEGNDSLVSTLNKARKIIK